LSEGKFQPHVEGSLPEKRLALTASLVEAWQPASLTGLTAIMTFTPKAVETFSTARLRHKNEAESGKHEQWGFLRRLGHRH
jgi:hypothetical protein